MTAGKRKGSRFPSLVKSPIKKPTAKVAKKPPSLGGEAPMLRSALEYAHEGFTLIANAIAGEDLLDLNKTDLIEMLEDTQEMASNKANTVKHFLDRKV